MIYNENFANIIKSAYGNRLFRVCTQVSILILITLSVIDAFPEKVLIKTCCEYKTTYFGKLDGALFAVQSFTTTGYGNYNELFPENQYLKIIAISLMLFGGFLWAWFIVELSTLLMSNTQKEKK